MGAHVVYQRAPLPKRATAHGTSIVSFAQVHKTKVPSKVAVLGKALSAQSAREQGHVGTHMLYKVNLALVSLVAMPASIVLGHVVCGLWQSDNHNFGPFRSRMLDTDGYWVTTMLFRGRVLAGCSVLCARTSRAKQRGLVLYVHHLSSASSQRFFSRAFFPEKQQPHGWMDGCEMMHGGAFT